MTAQRKQVGMVLFEGFELLDVAGPLECLCNLPDRFDVVLVGPQAGPVPSAQGPELHADVAWPDAPILDVVVVPGGNGTRALAGDPHSVTGWRPGLRARRWSPRCAPAPGCWHRPDY